MPEIVEFVPDSASPAAWPRFHAYRRVKHREFRPEYPLPPDDLQEVRLRQWQGNPFQAHRWFHVVDGDEVVGELEAEAATPASPEYETNRHLMWAWAYVSAAHRGRGIARSLVPTVLSLMDEQGATVLTTAAEDQSGFSFLDRLGGERRYVERESWLDLREVDWDAVARWVREGEAGSPGARLELYPRGDPDELLPELCAAMTELMNTMPMEELDHGDIVVTPEMARQQRARREATGTINVTSYVREPDGSIAAMTDVIRHPFEPAFVRQNFTGVHPRARGRGLGKWLKAAMLLYIRETYPETIRVITGNAGSNAAMLGINHALGYRLHREVLVYQVSRDALSQALS